MPSQIFVNLPVKDLSKSKAFYEALGYHFNPKFTDETAACLVISDTIYVMLLTKEKFASFTPAQKKVVDATQATEVLLALSFENKAEVDAMLEKVLAAGGTQSRPTDDLGFMYSRSFADPDGHIWEFFWMDPAQAQ